jgi:hypothetical protein
MKKLQPGDQIVRTDEELGIAWILLPPDAALGGFRGISPRIMNEEKFIMAKKKAEKKKVNTQKTYLSLFAISLSHPCSQSAPPNRVNWGS